MNKRKWRQAAKITGTVFVDLGKLSFGSLVLGTILKGGEDLFQVFIAGAGLSIVLFVIGVLFILNSEE